MLAEEQGIHGSNLGGGIGAVATEGEEASQAFRILGELFEQEGPVENQFAVVIDKVRVVVECPRFRSAVGIFLRKGFDLQVGSVFLGLRRIGVDRTAVTVQELLFQSAEPGRIGAFQA